MAAENHPEKALVRSPTNLPTSVASASVKSAFHDHLSMSEAVEAVGKMLNGYPQGKASAPKSYIGTIAALLCKYPRVIALECADPTRGVATTTEFLPTVARMVNWCEPHVERMQRIVDLNDRSATQLREREHMEALEGAEPIEHRRRVVERVRGDLIAAGMPLESDRARAHGETAATVKAKHGLTDAQWDEIPDQPKHADFWQGVRHPAAAE